MTRYLLGDLPEGERDALERRYFSDPRVFEEMARAETALVDEYVRGGLEPEVRRRFEESYLAHPDRRERVVFAEALASWLGSAHLSRRSTVAGSGMGRRLRSLIEALGGPRQSMGLALASLIVVSALVWLAVESRRPTGVPSPGAPPPAPAQAVTLALTIGSGVRGVDAAVPTTLVIPTGTAVVRLEMSLEENDYPRYRITLRPVGGAVLVESGDLTPGAGSSGPALTLTVAADSLAAGDYLLTLGGATGDGTFEDLSQSLLRVERR